MLSLLASSNAGRSQQPEAQAIVIDTETTGLTDSDELLQISVIDDAGTVSVRQSGAPVFHTEWPEVQKVNGITPEMVAGAPYPHELLPQLVEIFSEMSVCIGYNTSFDLGFLDRIGVPTEHLTVIDVMSEVCGLPKRQRRYSQTRIALYLLQNILITSGRAQHTTALQMPKPLCTATT